MSHSKKKLDTSRAVVFDRSKFITRGHSFDTHMLMLHYDNNSVSLPRVYLKPGRKFKIHNVINAKVAKVSYWGSSRILNYWVPISVLKNMAGVLKSTSLRNGKVY